ncbi:MAG: helix-turn-helix domain-containing protein [Myxococcales bacterium]
MLQTLERCWGNVSKAARELGVAESTLRSRRKAWGI